MIGRRVNLTLDDDTREKVVRLALACRKHPTTLAGELVRLCVNNPNIIEFIQRQHNVADRWKVRAHVEGGAVVYD